MASVVPVREHSEPKFAPRVLVVEDDPMIAWDVSESLQQAGFEVCGIATTGAAALEIADTMHPAAVVMDVNLKGGADGIQTAQRLRARGIDAPVIFVTGFGDPNTASRIQAINPAGYLLKPVLPDELTALLDRVLTSDQGP